MKCWRENYFALSNIEKHNVQWPYTENKSMKQSRFRWQKTMQFSTSNKLNFIFSSIWLHEYPERCQGANPLMHSLPSLTKFVHFFFQMSWKGNEVCSLFHEKDSLVLPGTCCHKLGRFLCLIYVFSLTNCLRKALWYRNSWFVPVKQLVWRYLWKFTKKIYQKCVLRVA